MFYLQNKGRGKAAKVVNFVAKWLNLWLSTVQDCINQEKKQTEDNSVNDHTKPLLLLGLLQPGIIIEFDRDSCEERHTTLSRHFLVNHFMKELTSECG